MATIIHDAFGGSGNPVGRTPDTVDNGNTWAVDASEDATFNVQTGYMGVNSTGASDINVNNLYVNCGTADVRITARAYCGTSSGDGGPVVRITDESDGITARWNGGTGELELIVLDAGGDTTLDVTSGLGLTLGSQYDIVLVADGTAITADIYTTGGSLLASLSGTSSVNQSSQLHGYHIRRSSSYVARCYDIRIEDAASLNGTVRQNGFDVIVTATSETVGNYTVKAGVAASETTRTIHSATRISATQVRLRLANGNRILSGQSVLVSSTADSITDEAATNGSDQAADSITYNGVTWAFGSGNLDEANVGIYTSGEPKYTGSNHPTSVTYTPGTGEEQYTIHGSMVNPEAGENAEHNFHPDAWSYNASATGAASFPIASMAHNDCLVSAVAFPALSTHATSSPFNLGDVIEEEGRYFRVTTAGTTAGTKPTFTSDSETVSDGTVTWTRGGNAGAGDDGRSLVRKVAVLTYESTLSSQDTFRPTYTRNATKRLFTRSDLDLDLLPNDAAIGGQPTVDNVMAELQFPWWEMGWIAGGSESESMPEDTMGNPYGRDMMKSISDAVLVVCSDVIYTDELIDYIVQRGIDYIGLREGGAYWRGDQGWSAGRLIQAIFVACLLPDDRDTLLGVLRTPPSGGSYSTANWRGYSEFADQILYVTEGGELDITMWGGFDYFAGNGGTHVNPANAPTTYSDSPTNAYHPASVRDTWEFVPEWVGKRSHAIANADPRWDAGDTYRLCCSAIHWSVLEYLCYVFDLTGETEIQAFLDYMERYYNIESGNATNYNATYKTWRDTHLSTHRPAYAVSSWSFSGTTVTVNYNRATYMTAATGHSISGGITLSSATQTGPRTWQFTASTTPSSSSTLSYASASGDAVDAGNNALPDQTNVAASGGGGGIRSRSRLRRGI